MRTAWRIMASVLLALPVTLVAQTNAPTFSIGEPRFTTGDLELDRVTGAGLLTDGRIAIANDGTFNVIIVNRRGTIEQRFGRKGAGPGDFGGLNRLETFGDTIVTWDGLLRRITLWRTDGTVIRSFLPSASTEARSAISLAALVSPSSYIATVRSYPSQHTNGVYLNSASLFRVDGKTRNELGQQPWAYTYFYAEGDGASSYNTPFLGETLVAAAAGKTLLLSLGETRVTLLHADGTRGSVSLPIKPVTGRERAKAYGDSMIAAQKDPDPRWKNRFEKMFGADFPVVERQAVAQRAVTVGGSVWFQEFQQPRTATTRWWIVDAQGERLVGSVALPASATVLGGDDQQVLVRLVDSDGVQSVGLFDFPKR